VDDENMDALLHVARNPFPILVVTLRLLRDRTGTPAIFTLTDPSLSRLVPCAAAAADW
jgi:hypothetical protein